MGYHLENAKRVELDTNVQDAKTIEFDCRRIDKLRIWAYNKSGAHNNQVIEVEVSGVLQDGTSARYILLSPTVEIAGVGDKEIDVSTYGCVRVNVKTPQGAASKTWILFNGFRDRD